MKSFVVALCVFAVAAAAAVDKDAQIVKAFNEQGPEGDFNSGFETDNGIKSSAAGVLRADAKGEKFVSIEGASEYVGQDGQVYKLIYTADENGYHPQADFLPTPPAPEPIPDYIQRSLEYNAAHPYVEPKSKA